MYDFSNNMRKRNYWHTADHKNDVARLNQLLERFGLRIDRIIDAPTVTTYQVDLDIDTKINAVLRLEKNFAIAVDDNNVRVYQDGAKLCIEKKSGRDEVALCDLYTDGFRAKTDGLWFMAGIDTNNERRYSNLANAPHLLVAGTTGSGKSVFLHQVMLSLLMNHPTDIDMIGIDPKGGTEFNYYQILDNFKLVCDPVAAVKTLKELCDEMDSRYTLLRKTGCRDIDAYNAKNHTMRRKVCVIDELSDLMGRSANAVESYIVRIAQLGRACGIHLVIATQSPRADVLTGLIKSNIPARVSLAVANSIESRIILDRTGAEKLNGAGDLLFLGKGSREPVRIQSAYITDDERASIILKIFYMFHPEQKKKAS